MRNGIAIAGVTVLDTVKYTEGFPVRDGVTKVLQVEKALGGNTANCGIALARLDDNLPINILGTIGADANGDYVIDRLSQYPSIDTGFVKRVGQNDTTDVMTEMDTKRRTMFAFKDALHYLDESCFPLEQINAKIMHVAYLCDLPCLETKDDAYGNKLARILHLAQQKGIETCCDTASNENMDFETCIPPALQYSDYFIINELEAGYISKIPMHDEQGVIFSKAKEVLYKIKSMGINKWLVVHSPQAVFAIDENDVFHALPTLDLPDGFIKGTVGAGDAFCSGVLYGAHQEYTIEQAMKVGIATASSSLSTPGGTDGVLPFKQTMELYHSLGKKELGNI